MCNWYRRVCQINANIDKASIVSLLDIFQSSHRYYHIYIAFQHGVVINDVFGASLHLGKQIPQYLWGVILGNRP